MTDPVIYQSTHPDVLDAYEAGVATRTAWHGALQAFVARHGDGRPAMVSKAFGGERLAGLRPTREDETNPPEGWRAWLDEGVLVPDRRRKSGKAIAAEMEAIGRSERPVLPGMPHDHWDGPTLRWPGMERHSDTVYVRWSAEPRPVPDPDVWERCPLSAYYAAVEAEEAEEAAASCA